VVAHHRGEREQQEVADQQTVDRLTHRHGVFPDIDEKQQHQLAREQHGRGPARRRCRAATQHRNTGEIGLEKMHDSERAKRRRRCPDVRGRETARRARRNKPPRRPPAQHVFELGHREIRPCPRAANGSAPPLHLESKTVKKSPFKKTPLSRESAANARATCGNRRYRALKPKGNFGSHECDTGREDDIMKNNHRPYSHHPHPAACRARREWWN